MAKKSYNEKLNDSKNMPEVIDVTDPKAVLRYGGTKMLISPPLEYDEIMKRVPEGKVITSDYIRSYLAKKHGADYTCQLTAGIFINIVAHASVERGTDKTPYWRTLKKDGERLYNADNLKVGIINKSRVDIFDKITSFRILVHDRHVNKGIGLKI